MSNPAAYIGSIHHISFRVDDLDAARRFYVDLLGCVEIERPDGLPGGRGAWLRAGSSEIHLTEAPAGDLFGKPASVISGQACHTAFRTTDVAAAAKALERQGIHVEYGPEKFRQIFVRDPSGNIIELSGYGQ